jgi:pyruvate dehydrogenase E2 component (dihydrolipoamide acetyltransferase)
VTLDVDVERIFELRKMFEKDGIDKPSLNDFVVRACALALREMPVVNSVYQGEKLLQLGAVNIGMAVALDDGLTLPVIHNADQLSLSQISAISKDLAEKARAIKLSPEELSGSTFSISNMGMLNVDVFAAILNPPNAGILAVGTAKKRAVVDDETGEIIARTRMNITGSFDHRVVDGAVGAKFMNVVREFLEGPTRLL